MHRGKKGETEFGYRETWNSTTATLVLLRTRGTAPIHGIAILRPHRTMMKTMDICNEKMNDMWESAPGIEPGSSAWKAKRVTAQSLWLLWFESFRFFGLVAIRNMLVQSRQQIMAYMTVILKWWITFLKWHSKNAYMFVAHPWGKIFKCVNVYQLKTNFQSYYTDRCLSHWDTMHVAVGF